NNNTENNTTGINNVIKGYLHSYSEASLIMHAVRLGLIQPIKERLSGIDRERITTGNIFVFIESEGIKRWTDGKIWSPSKILGHFLLYKEVPKYLSKSSIKKRNRENASNSTNLNINFNTSKNTNEQGLQSYNTRSYNNQSYYTQSYNYQSYDNQDHSTEFCLYKKTISIKHESKSYHIISYYQPIFDKRSIIEYPFFKCLNNSLLENVNLLNDKFVYREFFKDNIHITDIIKKYKLLEYKDKNIIAEYDRRPLEQSALILLCSRFDRREAFGHSLRTESLR
ncbi:Gluconate transport-inducing protein, partial [Pseudoloma neurophilia]